MLKRTHLAIGLAVALYFLPLVNNQVLFFAVVMISSILPDVDSSVSSIGRRVIFRPLQAMVKHRGFLHSYTFCIGIAVVLAFFFPILALPFFLGYSFHLFADSFTPRGIKPFWPFKVESKGIVKTGGRLDRVVFYSFLVVNAVFLIWLFYR